MRIISEGSDPVIVSVTGEVDAATAPELERSLDQALTGAGVTEVHVDMSEVEFLDSAGLRVLVSALHRAARAGQNFVLQEPHRRVRHIIELTGLSDLFGLTGTADAESG